jgi:hypothetical protein
MEKIIQGKEGDRLTPEQLMQPRYKVVALFPFNHYFSVGDVIECEHLDDREHLQAHERYAWLEPNENSPAHHITFYESEFAKYPHLFRKLEWWGERGIDQLPAYLKVNTETSSLFFGDFHKVRLWSNYPSGEFYCLLEEDKQKSLADLYKYPPKHFLPITEQEYLTHKNK